LERFVVFGQSPVFAQPSKRAFNRAFDDPPFRQDNKLANGVTLDDLDASAMPPAHPMHELPGVAAVVDPDSTAEKLVFNQTVALRDSWAKQQEK
jgi:hypothetical protein